MKYYKVNKDGDNRPVSFGSRNIFVGGELLTKGDVKRLKVDRERLEKYTEKVEVNSHKTYFCFGARFKNKFDAR